MGAVGARNGPWGFTTDIVYLDLGAHKNGTRDFSLGQIELPASVDANLQYDLTGWLWTTMGSYTVVDNDRVLLDVLAGARMLDLEQRLGWTFNGRYLHCPYWTVGHRKTRPCNGMRLLRRRDAPCRWPCSCPTFDAGTGDSTRPGRQQQGWDIVDAADLKGVWRYLDYDLGNHTCQSLSFNRLYRHHVPVLTNVQVANL
jgi:hypothetical protein